MVGRPYDEERDLAAVTRMWREIGWIDGSDLHHHTDVDGGLPVLEASVGACTRLWLGVRPPPVWPSPTT